MDLTFGLSLHCTFVVQPTFKRLQIARGVHKLRHKLQYFFKNLLPVMLFLHDFILCVVLQTSLSSSREVWKIMQILPGIHEKAY